MKYGCFVFKDETQWGMISAPREAEGGQVQAQLGQFSKVLSQNKKLKKARNVGQW